MASKQHRLSLASNEMELDDVQKGINVIKLRDKIQDMLNLPDTLQGVSLQELDQRLQHHRGLTLDAYLLWLQDKMYFWNCSKISMGSFYPQVQSFCDRLRHHKFKDNQILNSFLVWKSVHLKFDNSIQLSAQEVEHKLRQYLSWDNPSRQKRPPAEASELGRLPADNVSSMVYDEDSDGGVFDWTDPNPNHLAFKERKTRLRSHSSASDRMNGKNFDGIDIDDSRGLPTIDTRGTKTEKKGGKPPKSYVCNRCNEPGHLLKDCPTNLDPRYDAAPPAGYLCDCCGAIGDHFFTLCPGNTNRGSLTQLRVHAGINTAEHDNNRLEPHKKLRTNAGVSKASELPRADHWRPAHQKSVSGGLAQRQVIVRDKGNGIHADRLAMLERDYEDDVNHIAVDNSRYDQSRRSYQRHQSPRNAKFRDGNQYSTPPHKRSREIWEPKRDLSRGRDRDYLAWEDRREFGARGRNSNSDRHGPSELLTSSARRDGRLSYWDGYEGTASSESVLSLRGAGQPQGLSGTERPPGPRNESRVDSAIPRASSSPLRVVQRPATIGLWSNEREREIEERFPDADRAWVKDMASFDVNTFFDELDDFMAAGGTSQGAVSHRTTSHGATFTGAAFLRLPDGVNIHNETSYGTGPHDGQKMQTGMNNILTTVEERFSPPLGDEENHRLQSEMASSVKENERLCSEKRTGRGESNSCQA